MEEKQKMGLFGSSKKDGKVLTSEDPVMQEMMEHMFNTYKIYISDVYLKKHNKHSYFVRCDSNKVLKYFIDMSIDEFNTIYDTIYDAVSDAYENGLLVLHRIITET
jgi:hypothetical protein